MFVGFRLWRCLLLLWLGIDAVACHCEISANNYEKKIIPFPYYFQYLFCELVKQAEPNLYSQKRIRFYCLSL